MHDRRWRTIASTLALLLLPLLPGSARAAADGTWTTLSQARSNPAQMVAVDALHQRVFRFGGYLDGATATLSELVESPEPHWVDLAPTGPRPPARGYGSLVYDPGADRLLLFGGKGEFADNGGIPSWPTFGDLWEFRLGGTPGWAPLAASGTAPGPMAWHAAVFDPLRQRMYVFGAEGHWVLDVSGEPAWTPLIAGGAIVVPWHQGASAVLDAARDRILLFGGGRTAGQGTNRTFALALSPVAEWSEVEVVGAESVLPRFEHAAGFDAGRDRMIVQGGWVVPDPFNGIVLRGSDTYALDFSQAPAAWTRIDGGAGIGLAPESEGWVDFDGSRFRVLGGPVLGDLDLVTQEWSSLVPGNTGPLANPGQPLPSAAFDAESGRTYVFSGVELWSYTASPAVEWTLHAGAPSARDGAALVLDVVRRRLLLVGGRAAQDGSLLDEIRVFSLETLTWSDVSLRAPYRVASAACAVDPVSDRLLLFGGERLDPRTQQPVTSGDLLDLPLAGGDWKRIASGARGPSARSRAALVVNEATRRVLVFGGDDASGNALADFWSGRLGRRNVVWSELASPGTGIAARPALLLDRRRERLLIAGHDAGAAVQQIHAFDLVSGQWSSLAPAGAAPATHAQFVLALDAANDRLLHYAGIPGTVHELAFAFAPGPVHVTAVGGMSAPGASGFRTRLLSPSPLRGGVIEWSAESDRSGRLEGALFDVAGRQVATAAGAIAAGTAVRLEFAIRSLPPGLYLARLSCGAAHTSHRVVVTR